LLEDRFEWDGRDAYGRHVQGARRVRVRRAYQYGLPFYGGITGITTAPGFGRRRTYTTAVPMRVPEPEWQSIVSTFMSWDASPQELGGWTLDVHHTYDPSGRVLYRGDGSRRTGASLGLGISTAGGTGVTGDSGDGGPATAALLQHPPGLAVAPDGSVYFGQRSGELIDNSVVRAINPDGTIRRVAGEGTFGASGGDLFPDAFAYLLASPEHVAWAPDGSLYIADRQNRRVLRLRDPINSLFIERIAGTTGVYGYSGDGGDALAARFGVVAGIAVGADGWVYVADSDFHVVRAIAPDGTISTVAGTGSPGYTGDGGPATLATLQNPVGLALASDGSLYIADATNHAIRRLDRTGTITTVAGSGTSGYGGDGGLATSALLSAPLGVATAPDGTLYIADAVNHVIRAVTPAGIISTVAGRLAPGDSGDGGAALQAQFLFPSGIGVAPDGSLYVADQGASRILHIERPLSGFAAGDILVPEDDGSAVYVFDAQGRHQETRHGLTGATLYEFTYDPTSRLLTAIEDGDGNTTQIVRATDGTPLAIVAPDGQETTLAVDANGYLDWVENPADETTDLTHAANGLLEELRDARQNVWTFTYDDQGRLLRDDDPAGGYKTLTRTDSATGYEVAVRSAVELSPLDERVTAYAVAPQPGGGMTRSVTRPDGTVTSIIESADGGRATSWPDGRTRTVVRGADPRFGLLAARPTDVVTTSGSVEMTSITLRAVTPPDPPDPFSFTQLEQTTAINGRSYERTYDPLTRTWALTTPEQRQQFRTIDTQGRTTRSAVTGLHPLRWEYDTRGRLSAVKRGPEPDTADTRVTTFTYKSTTDDQNGYLDQVIDAVGRVVAFDYDDAGRVSAQTFQPGTAGERVVAYDYDENGNLTSLTPAGRPAHEFAHTAVNLEQAYDPPDIPLVLAPETTYG
jgi:YD repeat-containing protein